MDLTHKELLDLILESRKDIAEIKLLLKELPNLYKNWTLGGIIFALVTGIPLVVFLHKHLHPVEYSMTEKRMKQQSKTLDELLKRAKKLEDVDILSKTQ